MEFVQLWLTCLFFPLLFLAAVVFYILHLRSRYYKSIYARQTKSEFLTVFFDSGKKGEYQLGVQIERFAPGSHPLFNVYIPRRDDKTSEIDALLLTSETIYVFENKNYSGWIFGDVSQKMWTQTFNTHSKYRFYNPVMQNAGHIKALSNYLKLPIDAFTSVVVFADKAVFKKVNVGDSVVIHTKHVCRSLENLSAAKTQRFTSQEAMNLYEQLCLCTIVDENVKRKHIAEVHAVRG